MATSISPAVHQELWTLLTRALTLLGSPPANAGQEQGSVPGQGSTSGQGSTIAVGRPATATRKLAWGKKVSPVFRERVIWIGDQLGMDASDLMSCMAFESGRTFSPKVRNPQSSATGLIQFMHQTALDLGTTTGKLAAMTAEDQLNYVYKYFLPYKGRLKNIADIYMAILWPKGIGQPMDYPLFIKGGSAYAVNAGLDKNKDAQVSKAEAAAKVMAMLAEGLEPENAWEG